MFDLNILVVIDIYHYRDYYLESHKRSLPVNDLLIL